MTIFRTRNSRRALCWWLFVTAVFGLTLAIGGWVFVISVAAWVLGMAVLVGVGLLVEFWIEGGEA